MPARHLAHAGTTMQASNRTVGPVVLTPSDAVAFGLPLNDLVAAIDRLRIGKPGSVGFFVWSAVSAGSETRAEQ
jgi:hypothetical protein